MPRRTFITQQEAAARLGVTDRTIRNYISAGVLTGYRLPSGPGARVRIDAEDVERLLLPIPVGMSPVAVAGGAAR